ncbi:MAG: glycoside hydrolase/phage tail family protein [Pseudomonadota bacterium]
MATLALTAAGSALGASLLPAGISVLGTTITGATIGAQIGSLAGSVIDQALFSSGSGGAVEGPRLQDLRVTASTEGAPIPRIYGAGRLGGQIIWADNFEEEVTSEEVGGKGGGIIGGGQEQVTYTYYASFAVAIAEGQIGGLGRIWVDGVELDRRDITLRTYNGSETQLPDPLIASSTDDGVAPAFRGVAYVVFERLPIADYGNRLPQLSFEVFRPLDTFQDRVPGVVMIPGSGEFVYGTTPVTRTGEDGTQVAENVNTTAADTDFLASLDQLEAALPNAKSTALVVSWFGTDLRANACEIRPGIDGADKTTTPLSWEVCSTSRQNAYRISEVDGRASYGGTPSDTVVIEAITELKTRGHRVTLIPFILMDVPAGTTLPDPYNPDNTQSAFPWRGRITIDPAPGVAGTVDQTEAAADQVAAFVGTAAPEDFAIVNGKVRYSGPNEWTLRRQVLHNAFLAKAAGGIDAFVLSSELRALTRTRRSRGAFPFVDALVALADDVRTVLGPTTKITYAADWSEYFGYHPTDGSGDVFFHLDPLWAADSIDAIGIDLYWPLSDWRNAPNHLDVTTAASRYDRAYLSAQVRGGEGFDWYYASTGDRDAQTRTPITDGLGKPWTFRYKDLAGWWSNPHYNRIGGAEVATPTAWQPQSKPFWFTEVGCPSVDLGANQPNVFVDPKSSESALPHGSNGQTDELIQRRYLETMLSAFADPSAAGSDANPVSTVYGAPMVDRDHVHLYAWDARPMPVFPFDTETWGDGVNWAFGHWLNGRATLTGLDATVTALATDFGHETIGVSGLNGLVSGLVLDRVMSFREAVQPLELALFVDFIETGDHVRAVQRNRQPVDQAAMMVSADDLVEVKPEAPLAQLVRSQDNDLPGRAKITYISRTGTYGPEIAEAQKTGAETGRVSQANLALMLDARQASAIAESWLHEAWVARNRALFALPPSALAIEPGDVIALRHGGRDHRLRVTDITDGGARQIEARARDLKIYEAGPARTRPVALPSRPVISNPTCAFLDLPLLTGSEPEGAAYIAAGQSPWPGSLAILKSASGVQYTQVGAISAPATMGVLLSDLAAGPLWRWDHGNGVEVQLTSGALQSLPDEVVLDGANVAAVQTETGAWEVLQFARAELIAPRRYRVTRLLRGQAGTDAEMPSRIAAGAAFVLIDTRLARVDLAVDDLSRPITWRLGPAGKAVTSETFKTTEHAFVGLGRRPLSPVHASAKRTGGGITIRWVRRTRTGGDNWEQLDVPLGETTEAYEIDILNNGSVLRTLEATRPDVLYGAADIIRDFGFVPEAIDCAIYQISATWGRGAPYFARV